MPGCAVMCRSSTRTHNQSPEPHTVHHTHLRRPAGLHEEYQEARHWVANHLQFKDGSSVQFFEVNIRILGGLLSAYYLSDGDDMYLHKAQQLGDRWVLSLVRAFWQQQQQQQRPSSFMLCAKLPEHTWGCWPTASIHRCLETGG
eukprot:GHRQ01039093.1.p1 GENE.GHRQ01039093.1~~GHRQ01039093.1.p1  ORF type:complete len:144 (+),score=44.55 GHRQ01039093.1:200-631(+)